MLNYRIGILFVLLVACRSEKSLLIDSFEGLYDDFLNQNFIEIINRLDYDSQILVDRLMNPANFNMDSLAKIGIDYDVRYFCWRYYHSFGLDTNDRRKVDFIWYLMLEQISIFNHNKLMHTVEEKYRIGAESYTAFYYNSAGSRILDWLRFTQNEDHIYKLDLIYILQLHERSYEDIYGYKRKEPGHGYEDSFKSLYRQFGQSEDDILADRWFWNEQMRKLRKEKEIERTVFSIVS